MKRCKEHPKYTGKKDPYRNCKGCLALYLSRGLVRKPTAPPKKVIKDKSKYSRKKKHK